MKKAVHIIISCGLVLTACGEDAVECTSQKPCASGFVCNDNLQCVKADQNDNNGGNNNGGNSNGGNSNGGNNNGGNNTPKGNVGDMCVEHVNCNDNLYCDLKTSKCKEKECTLRSDCKANFDCKNFVCVPESTCQDDKDCDFSHVCIDSICIKRKPLTMAEYDALTTDEPHILYELKEVIGETPPENYFSFPYPSDFRLNRYTQGENYDLSYCADCPDIRHMPLPKIAILTSLENFIRFALQSHPFFSAQSAIYFSASDSVRTTVEGTDDKFIVDSYNNSNTCAHLINISRDRFGQRVPVTLTVRSEPFYTGEDKNNVAVLRPLHGLSMHPGDTYVAAITHTCLKTLKNKSLATPAKLLPILGEYAPDDIQKHYQSALRALDSNNVRRDAVIAMTILSTYDPVKELDLILSDIRTNRKNEIAFDTTENDVLKSRKEQPYDVYNDNLLVFRGTFKTLNYLKGKQTKSTDDKFTELGDGALIIGNNIVLRRPVPETVNFTLTIPYDPDSADELIPIAVYGHGTGGDDDTHTSSEGAVMAKGNIALLGFDAALQGKRALSAISLGGFPIPNPVPEMLFAVNPVAVRGSIQQTVIDMMVLYELIESGKLVLPDYKGKKIRFDTTKGLYMGHSQGAQEAGLLLATDVNVKSAFLSACGGGLSVATTQRDLDLNDLISSIRNILVSMLSLDCPEGQSCVIKISRLIDKLLEMGNPPKDGRKVGTMDVDSFMANHIVQPMLDAVDPLNYAYRYNRHPTNGKSKNIALSTGLGDRSTPEQTQFAFAAEAGLTLVGKQYVTPLAMRLRQLIPPDVISGISGNAAEQKATAAWFQFKMHTYPGKDPHFVIYYEAEATKAYLDFMISASKNDIPAATVANQPD